jgi:hypothetical protein
LSWEEFCELTFPQFEALEERRAIQIRHARHDAAFIVATLLNVNRVSSDSDWCSPFDFLPGFERDPQEVEAEQRRREVVRSIRQTFINMPDASHERVQEARGKIIARLKERGYEDAEQLMTDAFPNL